MNSTVSPLVIISPVRNEEKYLRLTLDSIVQQTVRPKEWIIVDDGSTDSTRDIVAEYAKDFPFIRLIERQDRGFRQLGGGVIAAFNFGKQHIQSQDYEYIAKLDGDMSFGPHYLEVMLNTLKAEPKLAAVSGKVFRPEDGSLVLEYMKDEMVAGQFKLYKREAFEEIGGFTETILWDGIDLHRCRMKGWYTKSFHHDDAKLLHHRLMGSSDKNVYKGRQRLGRGIWFMGYHPLYALASGLFRMHEKPYVVGGLIIIYSYFSALIKREPQFPDEAFIRSLRHWQLQELKRILTSPFRRDASSPVAKR